MKSTKSTENHARSALANMGYTLKKTPSRHWTREYYGCGYMVLEGNQVLAGAAQREYEMTLDDVTLFLEASGSNLS